MTTIRAKHRVNQTLLREFQAIGPVSTRISIDTIELFFRREAPAGSRTALEAAHGRRFEMKDCIDWKTGEIHGVRAIINRPSQRVVVVAAELLQANRSACVSRVDIAVDLQTESEESAETLAKVLDRHIVLKWRSPKATKNRFDTRVDPGATVYWVNLRRRAKRRPKRNLVMYQKIPQTIRLELRFFGSQAVRRAGLANPARLLELNPLFSR
jgi:hypothetical protein